MLPPLQFLDVPALLEPILPALSGIPIEHDDRGDYRAFESEFPRISKGICGDLCDELSDHGFVPRRFISESTAMFSMAA